VLSIPKVLLHYRICLYSVTRRNSCLLLLSIFLPKKRMLPASCVKALSAMTYSVMKSKSSVQLRTNKWSQLAILKKKLFETVLFYDYISTYTWLFCKIIIQTMLIQVLSQKMNFPQPSLPFLNRLWLSCPVDNTLQDYVVPLNLSFSRLLIPMNRLF